MNLTEIETREKIKEVARNIVERHFRMDISKTTREREYVLGRSMYYKLLRDNTRMSYQEIADTFKKNHATILHSIKQLNGYLEYDVSLKADFIAINNVFIEAVDNDLLERYNGEAPEETEEYLKLLQDFNHLKKRYVDLKVDHKKLIGASTIINEKYKELDKKYVAREQYFQRNGYIVN